MEGLLADCFCKSIMASRDVSILANDCWKTEEGMMLEEKLPTEHLTGRSNFCRLSTLDLVKYPNNIPRLSMVVEKGSSTLVVAAIAHHLQSWWLS